MSPDERPSKRDAFQAFLREGWVSLHLDARRPGVDVPTSFSSEPHLVLQYGQDMPIPIPDLAVTERGVTATLSFARTPHKTFVPWEAVYVVARTDGRGILYHEDVPTEVALMTAADAEGDGAAAEEPEPTRTTPRLRSVPADEDPVLEDSPALVPQTRRRKRPQLRLVK